MSTVIHLDPNRVAELEPVEKSQSGWAMLSPFSVPRKIRIEIEEIVGGPMGVRAVAIEYPGRKDPGGSVELSDNADPSVEIVLDKQGEQIVRVEFSRPVTIDQLAGVANRLNKAGSSDKISLKLSFRMAATVITEWVTTALRAVVANTKQ